jgi:hypothetical protein
MRAYALLLVASSIVGCFKQQAAPPEPPSVGPSGQTYRQAVERICNVDTLASVSMDEDPIAGDVRRFGWLEENVDNPDGIFLRTVLSVKAPAERCSMLREAMREVGVQRCPLADTEQKRHSPEG